MAATPAGALPVYGGAEPAAEYAARLREWAAEAGEGALAAADELLDAFVCFNFTGPLLPDEVAAGPAAVRDLCAIPPETAAAFRSLLTSDGEPAHRGVAHPALLVAALALTGPAPPPPEADAPPAPASPAEAARLAAQLLRRARALFAQQRVLSHLSHSLRAGILACLDALDPACRAAAGEAVPSAEERHLFRGLVHSHYHEPHLSADAFDAARSASGLRIELASELGVRTIHQTWECAQFFARAASAAPPPAGGAARDAAAVLPRVVTGESMGSNVLDRPRRLADNVAAGTVTAAAAAEGEADRERRGVGDGHRDPAAAPAVQDTPLSDLEQALIVGACINVGNKNPMHGLTNAEMLPYLERLMDEERTSWLVRCVVLLLRTRLERDRARVQARSFLQLAELVDQFSVPHGLQDGDVPELATAHRCRNFWVLLWPSIFELRHELVKRQMGACMFKTALDLAESIEAWSLVFRCCAQLGKKNKAEHLIRRLLEDSPEDPWLWSNLGDATRSQKSEDPTCPAPGNTQVSEESYRKAWELSGGTLTAAMRGLGELYLDLERWSEALECFEKTTMLNPVYGVRWFRHAWAALKMERWDRAAHCYTRCVQIDITDGHAWSNLALCHLKLERKVPAFHSLRQAKKYSMANWRIWDNLYGIAVEIGEYQEALRVLGEILELRGRDYPLKPELLRQLVDGVLGELSPPDGGGGGGAAAAAAKEGGGSDSDGEEAFGVLPLCHNVELDDEPPADLLRAAGEKAWRRRDAEVRHTAEGAERLRRELGRVLGRVTATATQSADVWGCASAFHAATGAPLDAFDAAVKEVRCATAKSGWQQLKTAAPDVLCRTERLCRLAVAVPAAALEARKVQTAPPPTQARLQADSVLRLAADGFGATPEYTALREAVARL